jgi:hypothetical protein
MNYKKIITLSKHCTCRMDRVPNKITVKRRHASYHDIIPEESTVILVLFSESLYHLSGQHKLV